MAPGLIIFRVPGQAFLTAESAVLSTQGIQGIARGLTAVFL
jgi:hypothetical protein